MDNLSIAEVRHWVEAANALRWLRNAADSAVAAEGDRAERQLDAIFNTSHKLAVYGSLAPGRANYHVVAPLGGEWQEGLVEGDLVPTGWGAALGYPAFRPRVGGSAVTVQVLSSALLATAWSTLDDFEGTEYRRILLPIFSAEIGPGQTGKRQLYTVANLYATIEAGPAQDPR